MKEAISFASEKLKRSGDSRDWTVLDALRDAIKDIEDGTLDPTMVYIAFRCRDPEDSTTVHYNYVTAGATNMEISGLLSQHLHRICR